MVRSRSRRMKKEQAYPYVSVKEVDDRLLDWILIYSTSEEMHENAVKRDKMLFRKKKAEADAKKTGLIELFYAQEMSAHYNFYNALANQAMEELLDDYEDKIMEMEQCSTVAKAVESVMGLEICELLTVLRLYKKGRYAEKYIPAIIAHKDFTKSISISTKIVYEQLAKGHSFEVVHEVFKESYEKAIEEEDMILADQEIEKGTPSYYKKRITELLEDFEVACTEVDSSENLELQEELEDNKRLIANLEKQAKSKDTQISRLQRDLSRLEKNEQALQEKFDEAKKLDGLKSMQIGDLRKELDEIQKAESSLNLQVTRLQNERDKVVQQTEQELSNRHKNELAQVQNALSSEVLSLTTVNEQLTSEIKKERDLSITLEEKSSKLEAFQSELMNKNYLVEQKNNSLALVITQLQEEKENLQRELSIIRDVVTGGTTTPAPQPTKAVESGSGMVKISDDLIRDLMLGINKPVESENNGNRNEGQIISKTNVS